MRCCFAAAKTRSAQHRRYALQRSFSLKKNREFHFVYRSGKSAGSRSVVLIYTHARHRSVRVGFSVSKKVGNAVTRNKVKRRMRDAFFRYLPYVKTGYSLVFIAKANIADESFEQIHRHIGSTLRRANLLAPSNAQPEKKVNHA